MTAYEIAVWITNHAPNTAALTDRLQPFFEERDQLRSALTELRDRLDRDVYGWAGDNGLRARIAAALAPRDSAPEPAITPVDARALYAAVQHVCWDQTETDSAAEKLKAIGESDGVAVWDPRRPRSDGSQIGWVARRDSGKETK